MPSMRRTAAAVATVLFAVGVQTQREYVIDPSTVSIADRNQWCQAQITSCPLLCLQLPGVTDSTTAANDCDGETLVYSCVCGNGLSPNASEYSQTIPYFECTLYGDQCVTNCGGNTDCAAACRTDNPCGAQSPTRVNTSTASSMTSTGTAGGSSNTNGVVYTGLGGSEATPTSESSSGSSGDKNSAQTALDLGRSYGLAVIFTGIFAGFALVM